MITSRPRSLLAVMALAACLFGSGCFTVVEKVEFESLESGTFSLITDLSQLYAMMESMGSKAPSEELEQEFTEMEDDLKKIIPELEAIAGISEITTGYDVAAYTATLSFKFQSLTALNQGMSTLYARRLEMPTIEHKEYFRRIPKGIERTGAMEVVEKLRQDFPEGDEEAQEAMVFFQDANFKLHYTFPRPVIRVSNPALSIRSGSREVEFPFYFFRPDFAEKTVATHIEL